MANLVQNYIFPPFSPNIFLFLHFKNNFSKFFLKLNGRGCLASGPGYPKHKRQISYALVIIKLTKNPVPVQLNCGSDKLKFWHWWDLELLGVSSDSKLCATLLYNANYFKTLRCGCIHCFNLLKTSTVSGLAICVTPLGTSSQMSTLTEKGNFTSE